MKSRRAMGTAGWLGWVCAWVGWVAAVEGRGADAVFSGPQPGEKTTGFKVLEVSGPVAGQERDPVVEAAGAPTVLVFVHTVERSLVPLLRVLDEYADTWKERLKGEVVFLAADRLAGGDRVKAATRSLRLKSRTGLSVDGAEGPGNYGLNKDCMMTVVVARENRVVTNFALVQPGIADGPRVLAALALLTGDTNPPTAEVLAARMQRQGREGGGRMARDGAGAGGGSMRPAAGAGPREGAAKEPFPGAVPEDPRLNQLLRMSIRGTNDVATVDRLLKEMETHVTGNAALTKQAVDGWARVLHFGDHYGTEHLRREGRAMMERLSKPPVKE